MKSRSLALHLSESAAAAGDEDADGDLLGMNVDTRVMLLKKYGGSRVPLRAKVAARVDALGASLKALARETKHESMARELGTLWLAWFAILSIERYTPDHDANSNIFSVIFEVARLCCGTHFPFSHCFQPFPIRAT